MQIIPLSRIEQQQTSKVVQQEQQQIEHQLRKQTPVITEQVQKIFCHSCATRTELISKEFFYTFEDGKAVFFCNRQEKNLWVGLYKLDS